MDSKKVKPILIGIAAVFLAVAGITVYINVGGTSDAVYSGDKPMICMACRHTYELSAKEFQELIIRHDPEMMMDLMAMPRFDCPDCGKRAVRSGIKCSGCDAIFVADYMRNPELKCTKCGKSNL